jgi:hypothetical protein
MYIYAFKEQKNNTITSFKKLVSCSEGYRNVSGLTNCSALPNRVNSEDSERSSCIFELDQLGDCAEYPYGYVIQPGLQQFIQPCFLLKFNKVR